MDYSAQSLVHGIRLLIIAGVIAYVALVVLIAVFQSRMVYQPIRELQMNPGSIGLAYEDVTFETDDEITLTGWFIPEKTAEKTVLFCHGNGGNISHRLDSNPRLSRFRSLEPVSIHGCRSECCRFSNTIPFPA